jgi:hypothetical protein
MLKYSAAIGAALALLAGLPHAQAQKATEIFIPIGQSPGLSGKYTKMGTIEAVNTDDQTVTMTDPSGSYTVEITENTRIWLDKSKLKQTNEKGTFSDLEAGRMVEVKYKDDDPEGAAEWIKVQVPE